MKSNVRPIQLVSSDEYRLGMASIVDEYKAAHPTREPGEISAEELAEKIGQERKVAENWLIRQVSMKKMTKRQVFYNGRFHTVYRKVTK